MDLPFFYPLNETEKCFACIIFAKTHLYMNLHEYQAKELLKKYNVPVQEGVACSTVAEAVAALEKKDFVVVSSHIPGTNIFATVHLSLSDASGDNAIFEYINEKLVIHHDRKYVTMTNSPIFNDQLAINTYWKSIPGTIMLPGTNRAADRFVRASYYIDAIPKTDNVRSALASVFGVIRNCSVPLGIASPTEPNISSTRWRTVADQKNMVYYCAIDNFLFLIPFLMFINFSM